MYQIALQQANELKDRFVIIDTYKGTTKDLTTIDTDVDKDTIFHLRNNVPGDRYGAAYFPHLKTILNHAYDESALIIHAGTGYDYSVESDALNDLKLDLTVDNLNERKDAALAILETINETHDTPISGVAIQDANAFIPFILAIDNIVNGLDTDNLGALSGQKLEDIKNPN